MLHITLKLTDDEAKNLLRAVRKEDTFPGPGQDCKSETRKMVEAKVMVAISEAKEHPND